MYNRTESKVPKLSTLSKLTQYKAMRFSDDFHAHLDGFLASLQVADPELQAITVWEVRLTQPKWIVNSDNQGK